MASIGIEAPRRGQRLGLSWLQWMMLGIIVLALGLAGWSLRGSLTRAVSIPEAMQSPRPVQIFGYLYSQGAYDAEHNWTFDIQGSDGAVMKVVYPTKPGNFEDAISVAATGRYNHETGVFEATQLLVKCPSKYQEAQK